MPDEFVMLGDQPLQEIARKLREIGDEEAAQAYEARLARAPALEEGLFSPRSWLNTQHQYGFIPPFEPGSARFHKIVSASDMLPDISLQGQRINVRLDYLRIYEYPKPLIHFGANKHTILFTFEARNQVAGSSEPVAFNQTCEARSGQDVADLGNPIFIGLTVGANGVGFSCETVNVGNSDDETFVTAITSQATATGISLLTTAQPALTPFIGLAKELGLSLAKRSRNVRVQKFRLGLDFDIGALGARLAIGSYVVVQVPRANEISWSDWSYDAASGTIVRTNLAAGEDASVLSYNAVVFRVSKYQEEQSGPR
jgi:hypothetical protein